MAISVMTAEDHDWVLERARAAGFSLAGFAPASGDGDDQRFSQWVDAGYAAEMEYLQRRDDHGDLLRGDLRRSMPWARSVLVCALNYDLDAPRSIDAAPATTGWIARYAWSGVTRNTMTGEATPETPRAADYHDVLLEHLRSIERDLLERWGEGTQTRAYVDTGPLLERGTAAAAGIGWIGKNTCVLNQEQGSWLLLAVIVTSLELPAEPQRALAAVDRCGTCTRCIDACPTDALLASSDPGSPRFMDAGRCIAYLTIEKKTSVPEDLRALMGRQVFGCDICQDVCPWNAKAARTRVAATADHPLAPRRELINPSLAWLASLDGAEFNRWFRGSPLERTRRKRVLRNVAIAMGNSGEAMFLPQLDMWAADAADPVLAETAAWAARRLRTVRHTL